MTEYYCTSCQDEFNIYSRSVDGAKYCPFCGDKVRNLREKLKQTGFVEFHGLNEKARGFLKENYPVKEEVELEGGYKVSSPHAGGFAKKEFVDRAKTQFLTYVKDHRRYKKAGETHEQVSIIRNGVPLFFEKERKNGRISRNKFFRTNEFRWSLREDKIDLLYDLKGVRFARRIRDDDKVSNELKSKVMAKALKS